MIEAPVVDLDLYKRNRREYSRQHWQNAQRDALEILPSLRATAPQLEAVTPLPDTRLDHVTRLIQNHPFFTRLAAGVAAMMGAGAVMEFQPEVAIAASNQAGYTVVKDSWSNPPAYSVTEVRMGWISPKIIDKSYACSSSVWPLIGSYGQLAGAQAGEIFEVSSGGITSYSAFTEAYPDEPGVVGMGITIREGDTVGALVRRKTTGTFTMGVRNFTTGKFAYRTRSQSANLANEAEFRTERTSVGSTGKLCNFGTLTVKYADATIGGIHGPLDSSTSWLLNRENMDYGTTILATTSLLTPVTLGGNRGNSWNFNFVAPS